MTLTIDISPEVEARLEAEAAKNGQELARYLQAAVEKLFLPDDDAAKIDAGWDSLSALTERCQMDTGITDLAHQHDCYSNRQNRRSE